MESKISQEKTKTKKQLKKIEYEYLENTGKLLTSRQLMTDPTSKLCMDKIKYCKALVYEWRLEKKWLQKD